MGRLLSRMKAKHAERMASKPALRKFVTGLKAAGDIALDFVPGGSAVKVGKTIAKASKMLKTSKKLKNAAKSSVKSARAQMGSSLRALGQDLRQSVLNESNTLMNHANVIRNGFDTYARAGRHGPAMASRLDDMQRQAASRFRFNIPQGSNYRQSMHGYANAIQPPQFLPILNNY